MGIHTYWSNQDLILNILNVKKSGWYILSVIAKNSGKNPDFYKFFNLSVYDKIKNKNIENQIIFTGFANKNELQFETY